MEKEIDFDSFTREQLYDLCNEYKIDFNKEWLIDELVEKIKEALRK